MNQQFKYMLLLISTLALLVSACASPSLAEGQPASAQGVEPPTGAQTEIQLTSEGNVSDADQGISVESSQFAQIVPAMDDAIQEVDPGDIPILEERDAMLDGVNHGGLVFPESEQAPVGEGPAPGTESILAPGSQPDDILDRVNQGGPLFNESIQAGQFPAVAPEYEDASQAVDPEDIPSLEERDAMLDWVNRGGLVFPESEQAPVGEGPAPGTESILAPGTQADDILDRVNQGGPVLTGNEGTETVIGVESISNPADEAGFFHALNQFVETMRTWLQEVFD